MLARYRHRSTSWLLLLAAVVLLRAAIPVGYMPGNLLAGEFVRLCPAGLPADAFGGHHAGHSDHGDESGNETDGSCPVGFALQAASLVDAAGSLASPALLVRQPRPVSHLRPAATLRSGAQARAPPATVPALT